MDSKDTEATGDVEGQSVQLRDIESNSIIEANRDESIAYQYFIKGLSQVQISSDFGISQPRISQILERFKNDEKFKNRLISVWEKDISLEMRRKATALVASLNPDGMPDGSKATSVGILIDKARLIDGERVQGESREDVTRALGEIMIELARRGLDKPNSVDIIDV